MLVAPLRRDVQDFDLSLMSTDRALHLPVRRLHVLAENAEATVSTFPCGALCLVACLTFIQLMEACC